MWWIVVVKILIVLLLIYNWLKEEKLDNGVTFLIVTLLSFLVLCQK